MNRKSSLWMGTAFPLVLACIGLTDCGGNASPTFPPTAIAVKRYLAGGGLDASFSGGAVATKIDPSEFEYALAGAGRAGRASHAGRPSAPAGARRADLAADTTAGAPGTTPR